MIEQEVVDKIEGEKVGKNGPHNIYKSHGYWWEVRVIYNDMRVINAFNRQQVCILTEEAFNTISAGGIQLLLEYLKRLQTT